MRRCGQVNLLGLLLIGLQPRFGGKTTRDFSALSPQQHLQSLKRPSLFQPGLFTGQEVFSISRVGSGGFRKLRVGSGHPQPTRPDPTRPDPRDEPGPVNSPYPEDNNNKKNTQRKDIHTYARAPSAAAGGRSAAAPRRPSFAGATRCSASPSLHPQHAWNFTRQHEHNTRVILTFVSAPSESANK